MQRFIVNDHQQILLKKSGDYEVQLTAPGAYAEIKGSFLVENSLHLNINLTVIHSSPHTSAKTVLKGVAKDKAQVKFFGRIKIEKNCPDTQSFLEERILLLSNTAIAEAVPELEILSDDVKCSHAASISKIPDEHLFYLMSRGLSQLDAEKLIIEGFLDIQPAQA